jgi:hypothetical protein
LDSEIDVSTHLGVLQAAHGGLIGANSAKGNGFIVPRLFSFSPMQTGAAANGRDRDGAPLGDDIAALDSSLVSDDIESRPMPLRSIPHAKGFKETDIARTL